ncbi:MAG TPA: DUF4961 domain-containing protein [Arenibacter sp.]|nr:DUF4961 domain-containing protein [Arenibacter sp.]
MKNFFKTKRVKRIGAISLPVLFLLFTMCITILNVSQPTSATIGEEISITIDVDVASAENASHNIIFGVLVPESWDIKSSAVATYTSENGNGTFRLATSSDPDYSNQMADLVGIGENYGLVKWVTFISDDVISGAENVGFTGQVQLTLKVGPDNVKTQMGYVVATSGYGISSGNIGIYFTPCMEVSGGDNPLIDLCGPLPFPVTVQPKEYTFDDIIHIQFNATKGSEGNPTALVDANQVFLCGSVIVAGETITVCDNNAASTMRKMGENTWEVSIWARSFFGLSADAEISNLFFSFTNEAGDIVVGNPDTGGDFELIPNCSN